ncbi:MAG: GNAT family N-acetyltransferase [Sphingobacterium sp.]|jgi:dTDP-4-amino-4,6-dideoxy-D-galactose acyltransferase|nr:GNAT family N-acetyltransferase [Sphingobacterium sp.]
MYNIKLVPLKWDSDFFGYNVAKLEVAGGEVPTFLSTSGYRLVYVFSDKPIIGLEQNLMDKKANFYTKISSNKELVNKTLLIEPFDKQKHSYNELINLTLESGVFSRFFVDKNFVNDEYSRLYTKWIENSVSKVSALEVFVAVEHKKILGFITLTKKAEDLADIGLLAVSPEARGRRVASTLIEHAKISALHHGFEQMQVVTQLDNEPAVKLYKSTGFELNELTFIYHIWNNDTI